MNRIRNACAAVGLAILLAACGGGEIDQSEVREGDVVAARPATLRDGGDPVTGTVVKRNKDGELLELTEFVDGYPTGTKKEWFENGQLAVESEVKLVKSAKGQGLLLVGTAREWCENGTLMSERHYDDEGKPVGTHQSWTCSGKQVYVATLPEGEFKRWQELEDGNTALTEEGTRVEGGLLDGEHKSYSPDGKPMLVESWADGKQNGPYERWNAYGQLLEAGRYDAGRKVGTWVVQLGDVRQLWIYDPDEFTNPEYAGAFMAAAGIEANAYGQLREYQVDLEKIDYYLKQGLVDAKKKINLSTTPYREFQTKDWTAPYVTASRGALAKLREIGADPKAIDSSQRSRLHYCVQGLHTGGCSAEELKELLALGLDAKQADARGDTPLHLLLGWTQVRDATTGASRKVTLADIGPSVQSLLDAGADPDAQNSQGQTPIMLAVRSDLFDVATLLLEKSKNPTLVNKQGFNLVHIAFLDTYDRFELEPSAETRAFVELLVKKGVDPHQKIGDGDSLKQIAEKNGAIDLAQYLAGLKP